MRTVTRNTTSNSTRRSTTITRKQAIQQIAAERGRLAFAADILSFAFRMVQVDPELSLPDAVTEAIEAFGDDPNLIPSWEASSANLAMFLYSGSRSAKPAIVLN